MNFSGTRQYIARQFRENPLPWIVSAGVTSLGLAFGDYHLGRMDNVVGDIVRNTPLGAGYFIPAYLLLKAQQTPYADGLIEKGGLRKIAGYGLKYGLAPAGTVGLAYLTNLSRIIEPYELGHNLNAWLQRISGGSLGRPEFSGVGYPVPAAEGLGMAYVGRFIEDMRDENKRREMGNKMGNKIRRYASRAMNVLRR